MSGLTWTTSMALWGRYDPGPTLDELTDACWNHARSEGIGPYRRDR